MGLNQQASHLHASLSAARQYTVTDTRLVPACTAPCSVKEELSSDVPELMPSSM